MTDELRRVVGSTVFWSILSICCGNVAARADEAEIVKSLKEKGAEITLSKGVAASLSVNDGSKLTDADIRQIGQLTHLKSLSVSMKRIQSLFGAK
jgi:uncharacterized Zn ribbon protein